MTLFSAVVGAVILFTFFTGGGFSIGTSPAGPRFSLGYQGPSGTVG
jgi:hypothetical protein